MGWDFLWAATICTGIQCDLYEFTVQNVISYARIWIYISFGAVSNNCWSNWLIQKLFQLIYSFVERSGVTASSRLQFHSLCVAHNLRSFTENSIRTRNFIHCRFAYNTDRERFSCHSVSHYMVLATIQSELRMILFSISSFRSQGVVISSTMWNFAVACLDTFRC